MPFIGQLNPSTPTGADPVSQGDDQLRNLKQTLQDSFPGLDSQPWQKADAVADNECATFGQTKAIIKNAFPVGSVYITVGNVNPSTIFAGTTWSQIAQGRFIAGVGQGNDGSENRTYTAGNDSVGEYRHQLTEAELAAHTHNTRASESSGASSGCYSNPAQTSPNGLCADQVDGAKSTGGDEKHENCPPAFGLYLWERTA